MKYANKSEASDDSKWKEVSEKYDPSKKDYELVAEDGVDANKDYVSKFVIEDSATGLIIAQTDHAIVPKPAQALTRTFTL